MLPTVKQLVALRPLQHTLLDYDILNVFKDWIEPRDAKTLPSLPVRTAIYESENVLTLLLDLSALW